VTRAQVTKDNQQFRQIEKLVNSKLLHNSISLCKLLCFLARIARENPGRAVKEHQIATEVFERPDDFDPRFDSTVRVQIARLRSKLEQYYATEGAADSIVVEIPKGSYQLSFRPGGTPPPTPGNGFPATVDQQRGRRRWMDRLLVVVGLVAAAGLIAGLVALSRDPGRRNETATVAPPEVPSELTAFWKPFLSAGERVLVVYSNAEFVGRPETGMRYFDPSRDSRAAILDHYTGVGEVIAVHELDHLFFRFGNRMQVKRGRLLTLDDAKNSDLVFIGSPSENLSLRDLPETRDFVFRTGGSGTREGDLAIHNLRPLPGEQPAYIATPGPPVTEDFSLIARLPGFAPSRRVLILAGTTTLGTQAAVEFVCQPWQLRAVLSRLRSLGLQPDSPFEAVIRVRINKGVPVESKLVALHATGSRQQVGP